MPDEKSPANEAGEHKDGTPPATREIRAWAKAKKTPAWAYQAMRWLRAREGHPLPENAPMTEAAFDAAIRELGALPIGHFKT
jgi:hypothetical protein